MRFRPARILIAVAAAVALSPPSEAAAWRTHRDPVHKFSLKVFRDWEQVPVEAGQTVEVATFHDPTEKGDWFQPTLKVVRVTKRDLAPVTGSGGRPTDEEQPDSVWDVTIARLRNPMNEPEPPRDEFKKIRSADKVDGRFYVVTRSFMPNDPAATVYAMLTVYEKDGVEYGLYMTSNQRRGEKFENDFVHLSKSFKFFDENAGDVQTRDELDGVNISPKRRRQIEASLIKGWDLMVSPKQQYVILYNTKEGDNTQLARTIAERIEKIREQVYEKQFPPAAPIEAVSIVRVCKDRVEYIGYGGSPSSAGYWNSGTEELVFYDASASKKIDDDTIAVLYHEAFHQFIFYSVGSVAPHSWFNEGHGDYYAGAEYMRGRFKIEPFVWRVATVKNAIRQGPRPFRIETDPETQKERKVWEDRGYTPLAELVAFSQRDYYAYPGVSYAQGWSLVYFLRERVPRKKEWREKWGHILDVYFDTLKAEVNKTGELVRGGTDDPDEDPEGPPDPGDAGDPDAPGAPDGKPAPPDGDPGTGGGDDPGPAGGGDEGEGEPVDPGFQPIQEGLGPEAALKKALEEAFKGVDFEELEKAWLEEMSKISG